MPLNGYMGDSFHFRSNVEYKMSSKMASSEISDKRNTKEAMAIPVRMSGCFVGSNWRAVSKYLMSKPWINDSLTFLINYRGDSYTMSDSVLDSRRVTRT